MTTAWIEGVVPSPGRAQKRGREGAEGDAGLRSTVDAASDAVLSAPIGGGLVAEVRGENHVNSREEAGVSASGLVERASPRTLWLALLYRAD